MEKLAPFGQPIFLIMIDWKGKKKMNFINIHIQMIYIIIYIRLELSRIYDFMKQELRDELF